MSVPITSDGGLTHNFSYILFRITTTLFKLSFLLLIMGNTMLDLKKFLKAFHLPTYEVSCYSNLLLRPDVTAKDLSKHSKVPTGRIYDALSHLMDIGLVELHEVRPKRYRAVSPTAAFQALLAHKEEEDKGELQLLYNQARDLESTIAASNFLSRPPENKTFWSSAFGIRPIVQLYQVHMRELKSEFLFTGFINEHTEQALPLARYLYRGLAEFLARHGRVRFLWSFDLDEHDHSDVQKAANDRMFRHICQIMDDALHVSTSSPGVEIKYVHTRIFTYFDLFDQNRVILKLRNPLSSSQIFSCITVLDPELVRNLARYFNDIWFSHAIA